MNSLNGQMQAIFEEPVLFRDSLKNTKRIRAHLATMASLPGSKNVYKIQRSAYLRGAFTYIPRHSHAQSKLIKNALFRGVVKRKAA